MFDDRLEIRSPGAPIEPVTLDRLRRQERVHASRNPRIAHVLTELGLMRELGEGIPRMYEEMGRAGLYPPELALAGESFFTVVLRNALIYSVETERWLRQFEHMGLSVDQLRLLAYAREHDGAFTSRVYQRLVGTDIYGASRDIKDLLRKGLVRRQKKGGRTYHLMEPSSRPELPADFQKVRVHLDANGYLTNRIVRSELGVDRHTALRLLAGWTDDGLLDREGEKRGARYLPGPRLGARSG
jgi:ATP-dependent DNA helicase RecG